MPNPVQWLFQIYIHSEIGIGFASIISVLFCSVLSFLSRLSFLNFHPVQKRQHNADDDVHRPVKVVFDMGYQHRVVALDFCQNLI